MFKLIALVSIASLVAAQKSSGIYGSVGETWSFQNPTQVEFAQNTQSRPREGNLESMRWDYSAPALSSGGSTVHLPKGPQEVVDIPHANIQLPGNSLQNKDLYLDLPSPIVEAPRPIIKEREVLFKLPQPIFIVPRPIIQHKPMVYHVPHTVRTITPHVNLKHYLFKVPQLQVQGKSSYTQPIPATYRRL